MTFHASTGLRNKMLDTGSFKARMDGGLLKVYSGTVPADADAALGSATLLCTYSDNGGGGGLNYDTAAVAAVLSKAPAQVWQGTNAASGTASFYRFVRSGDTGVSSSTEERIQGNVALAGSEMNMSSLSFTSGQVSTINSFVVSLPTY
jgi:hypothetical protein